MKFGMLVPLFWARFSSSAIKSCGRARVRRATAPPFTFLAPLLHNLSSCALPLAAFAGTRVRLARRRPRAFQSGTPRRKSERFEAQDAVFGAEAREHLLVRGAEWHF